MEQLIHPREPETDYELETREALAEWQAAVNYFQAVSDPPLVEYATYQVEAARRKYEYLLNRIRTQDADLRD